MEIKEEDYLAHYGILRKSGRYPWGSGPGSGTQSGRNKKFLDIVADLRSKGMSDVEICRGFDISTTQLRAAKSIAKNEQKQSQITEIERLRAKGMSNVAIGARMGLPESTVRALQKEGVKEKADILTTVSDRLKKEVDEKNYIDVGTGVEHHLGISSTMLSNAVAVLREQGYELHDMNIQQLGTGLYTKFKVLTHPGTTREEVFRNKDKVQQVSGYFEDNGRTALDILPPLSINPRRVDIRYSEDGGAEADGVIYVRRGVKDVSLGSSHYAQVRISVGDGHYLKGMAMYKDDLPDGIDLQFNTNKSNSGNKFDAMKKVSGDPDNPYGAQISRQISEFGRDGKQKVTSAMNIVNEEGDWSKWSKNLSSQFLSKQSPALARSQLNMKYESRKQEFDELTRLTNPTVRKKLLESFGDDADSAAVHLKAAALNTKQGTHVILPISSMKPTEIYAPNYEDGTRVVLVRHPHGGRFELPELVVNNSHPEAKKLLGNARDAVGIHHSVAERLSGADFDGDTVIVIPNDSGKIKTAPALVGLKNFDPRSTYKAYEGMPKMTPKMKQRQMGDVSNLITDMTIMGASTGEIARAVRHSMVVIDAEKHNLNYKQSAIDNGIAQLKEKYQGGKRGGAATIISRAGGEVRVPDRKARSAGKGGPIDKATGRRVFEDTGLARRDQKGELTPRTKKVKRLSITDDAHTLLSGPGHEGTPMERLYADHSNKLKDLANAARKESVNTPRAQRSPSAAKTYAKEVQSLNASLFIAQRNAPLERQAQLIAGAIVHQKRQANPDMEEASLKKVKAQALNAARARTGAKKDRVVVSDREWEAIQAGAISDSKLSAILSNADLDVIKAHATPREAKVMTAAKTARAQSMLNSGYTRAQVARALGVSLTTLDTVTDVKE